MEHDETVTRTVLVIGDDPFARGFAEAVGRMCYSANGTGVNFRVERSRDLSEVAAEGDLSDKLRAYDFCFVLKSDPETETRVRSVRSYVTIAQQNGVPNCLPVGSSTLPEQRDLENLLLKLLERREEIPERRAARRPMVSDAVSQLHDERERTVLDAKVENLRSAATSVVEGVYAGYRDKIGVDPVTVAKIAGYEFGRLRSTFSEEVFKHAAMRGLTFGESTGGVSWGKYHNDVFTIVIGNHVIKVRTPSSIGGRPHSLKNEKERIELLEINFKSEMEFSKVIAYVDTRDGGEALILEMIPGEHLFTVLSGSKNKDVERLTREAILLRASIDALFYVPDNQSTIETVNISRFGLSKWVQNSLVYRFSQDRTRLGFLPKVLSEDDLATVIENLFGRNGSKVGALEPMIQVLSRSGHGVDSDRSWWNFIVHKDTGRLHAIDFDVLRDSPLGLSLAYSLENGPFVSAVHDRSISDARRFEGERCPGLDKSVNVSYKQLLIHDYVTELYRVLRERFKFADSELPLKTAERVSAFERFEVECFAGAVLADLLFARTFFRLAEENPDKSKEYFPFINQELDSLIENYKHLKRTRLWRIAAEGIKKYDTDALPRAISLIKKAVEQYGNAQGYLD
jgi:hypothetical protein